MHMRSLPLFALLLACPPSAPSALPTLVSFSATSQSMPSAGEVTLAWVQADATSLMIDNGVGEVFGTSKVVYVATTTTFTLTAANQLGSVQKSVTVTVQAPTAPPTITGFTASPWQLPSGGGKSTLLWYVNDAESIVIDQGVGDVTGKSQVVVNTATSRSYTLTATNQLGSATAQVTILVSTAPPTIHSFYASPANRTGAGYVTLFYNTEGATDLWIDAGVGTLTWEDGAVSVYVSGTTTFTLNATNSSGWTRRHTTVWVD